MKRKRTARSRKGHLDNPVEATSLLQFVFGWLDLKLFMQLYLTHWTLNFEGLGFNCKPFLLSPRPNAVTGKVICLLLEASNLSLLFLLSFAHAITLDILLCHVSTSHLVITPHFLSLIASSPKIHLAPAGWQLNREILKLCFVSPACLVMKSGSIEVGGRGNARPGPDIPTTISRHTRHT